MVQETVRVSQSWSLAMETGISSNLVGVGQTIVRLKYNRDVRGLRELAGWLALKGLTRCLSFRHAVSPSSGATRCSQILVTACSGPFLYRCVVHAGYGHPRRPGRGALMMAPQGCSSRGQLFGPQGE